MRHYLSRPVKGMVERVLFRPYSGMVGKMIVEQLLNSQVEHSSVMDVDDARLLWKDLLSDGFSKGYNPVSEVSQG